MSAEAEIVNLLSEAQTTATNLASLSSSLLARATGILRSWEMPTIFTAPEISDAGRDELVFAPSGSGGSSAPAIPTPPKLSFGDPPQTSALNNVTAEFGGSSSLSLDIPDFSYSATPDIPKFYGRAPTVDASFAIPAFPSTQPNYTPKPYTLMTLASYSIESIDISLAKPDIVATIDVGVFDTAFSAINGDIQGDLDSSLADLDRVADQIMGELYSALVGEMEERFANRYSSGYLASTVFSAQLNAERQRLTEVIVDRSGWGIPDAAQHAMNFRVTQQLAAWLAHVDSQQDTHEWMQAKEVLQAAGEAYKTLMKGAYELKIKQLEALISGYQAAVLAAKKASIALYEAFEAATYMLQEVEQTLSAAEIAAFDANARLGLAVLDIQKVLAEQLQDKQEQNKLLAQQFETDVNTIQQQLEAVAALAKARKDELATRQIELDIFAAQVKAYDQSINGFVEEVRGKSAGVMAYEAAVGGALKKIEAFEAEVAAFDEQIRAKMQKTEAEKERNAGELSRYHAEFKARLADVQRSQLEAKRTLALYEADATDFLGTAKLAVRQAQAEADFLEKESDAVFKAFEINQNQLMDMADAQLSWAKACADVMVDSADVYANMAQGAMSAANGVASAIFSESA